MRKQIIAYIQRDLQLEWKQKSIIGSSLIYLVSTVFICMHAFEILDPDTWNALFWIVMIFACLTVVSRSFENETNSLFQYHYHLAKPEVVLVSKMLLNTFYCFALGVVSYLVFSVFLGNQIQNHTIMGLALLLGGTGLGSLFTLTSALSARINGNLVLTSILSIPILLPLLLVFIQLTERAFSEQSTAFHFKLIGALFFLNVVIVCVSYLLFPYLWRD